MVKRPELIIGSLDLHVFKYNSEYVIKVSGSMLIQGYWYKPRGNGSWKFGSLISTTVSVGSEVILSADTHKPQSGNKELR